MNNSPEPALPKKSVASKRRPLPSGWGPWIFVGILVLVLVAISLPVFNTTCVKGEQTVALAQARQVGLALKLFAGDNDGNYPRQGASSEMKDTPANSNQALAALFPTYTTSGTIFSNKKSAYQANGGQTTKSTNLLSGRPWKR